MDNYISQTYVAFFEMNYEHSVEQKQLQKSDMISGYTRLVYSKVQSIDRYTSTFSINKALFSILASQQEQYCILKPSEAHKS